MTQRLYFDYNATAPLASGLKEKMSQWLDSDFKNPSSVHQDGQKSKAEVEASRKKILKLLGAQKKDQLIFTSGGTESNNIVLQSAFASRGSKNKLVLTRIEHSCVINTALELQKQGAELIWLDVSASGEINWEQYQNALSEDVFLVACMLANNETGFLFPIQKMAALAHQHKIPFLTDAVCAIGKIPVDFEDLGVDYFTFSSHKFGALKGIGGIIYHSQAKLKPLIYGGPQENEKRAGTQNVLGILSSAYALETQLKDLNLKNQDFYKIRDYLKMQIQALYPKALILEAQNNLAQTLNIAFSGLEGTLLLTNLDLENVSVSHGSACASGSLEISHVLRHIAIQEGRSAIRFSFGSGTRLEDAQELIKRLEKVLKRMQ